MTLRVGGPILLLASLIAFVVVRHPVGWWELVGLMVVFTFTPAGKFTAGILVGQGIPVGETVFILGTIDVAVALFLVFNFPLVHRIPRVGAALARREVLGRRLLERRDWVRRTAFLGLVLLAAVPFQGTGAVAGPILGRILGMGAWRTVAAVAIGGYGGIALVAGATRGLLPDQALVGHFVVLLLVLLAVAYLLWQVQKSQQRRVGQLEG